MSLATGITIGVNLVTEIEKEIRVVSYMDDTGFIFVEWMWDLDDV